MRIVYVITRADAVGGASIHVRDLAREMGERGHDVTVLVGGRGPVTDQLEAAGVPFQGLRWLRRQVNPLRDALALAELVRALRALKPDLVSTHTAKAGAIGRVASRLAGFPALYTPHGWPAGERMPLFPRFLFGLVEGLLARWCEMIVCVCESERRLAIEKGIARPAKLEVVHNGVRDVGQELHARPDGTPVRICSVARFEDPKNHAVLLRALSLIRELPWSIDLIGDGPREPAMRRLAVKLGLGDRVRFHGALADPAPLLAQAQLFVLSSRSEAFPRSILEAFRAGLPVVASNVGGVGEAVTDGTNGLLVPPGDTPALAAALKRLIESGALRKSMGEAGRAAYAQRYRLEIMADKTSEVYVTVQSRTGESRSPA
jgi:glycosyltransferase involved in cell wall biosynthesis